MECFYNLVQYALFLQAIYFLESEIYYRLFGTLQTSVRISSTTFCCLFTKHIHNMTRHYRHTLEFFQTCEKREKYYCFVFLLFVFAQNKVENLWALDVRSTLYIACKLYVKKCTSQCILYRKIFFLNIFHGVGKFIRGIFIH